MTIQKGIVYRTVDGYVLYKFETESLPTLNTGEAIKLRADANLIQVGSIYYPGTDTYGSPGISTRKNWKYIYQQAATDADRIGVIAQFLKLK